MADYKLTLNPSFVQRTADKAFIPNNPDNKDYLDYLAWVAAGNLSDPAETPEETAARLAQEQEVTGQKGLQDNLKMDAIFDQLKTATPAQINTFVNNQFPAFTAQQRAVMKMLIQVAALVVRRL